MDNSKIKGLPCFHIGLAVRPCCLFRQRLFGGICMAICLFGFFFYSFSAVCGFIYLGGKAWICHSCWISFRDICNKTCYPPLIIKQQLHDSTRTISPPPFSSQVLLQFLQRTIFFSRRIPKQLLQAFIGGKSKSKQILESLSQNWHFIFSPPFSLIWLIESTLIYACRAKRNERHSSSY